MKKHQTAYAQTDLYPMKFYKLTEFLCALIGQWPYQGQISKTLLKIGISFILVASVSLQIMYFIEINFELAQILQQLPIFVSVFSLLELIIIFHFNTGKFEGIWIRMLKDWASERIPEETKIKESYAKIGRLLNTIVTILVGFGTIIFVAATSCLSKIFDIIDPLNESRPPILPFPIISVIDSEKYFFALLIMQEVTVIVCLGVAIANQTVLCMHILHIYGMFAVIGYRLQNALLNNHVCESSWRISSNRNEIFCKSIKLCVKRHQEAIEFASELQSYYGSVFCVCIIGIIFIISPTLVQLADSNLIDYKAVLQIILAISFLFVNSYFGQKLIDISSEISEKAYNSPWYLCSPHLQKLILLIIRRCDEPCSVGVYNMYMASLGCFRMVIQTGISYCMALRQIQ